MSAVTKVKLRPVTIPGYEVVEKGTYTEDVVRGDQLVINGDKTWGKCPTGALEARGIALLDGFSGGVANVGIQGEMDGYSSLPTNGAYLYPSDSVAGGLDTAPPAVSNAVQVVTINGGPAAGTFTLTYRGQTTAAIAYNATAATVKAALEALSNVGAGNVNVAGSAGGPYTITFQVALGGAHQPLLVAVSSLTGGTSPSVSVVTSSPAIQVPGRVIAASSTKIRYSYV